MTKIPKRQLYKCISPVLVKRNRSVAKHLNQFTAAAMSSLKYNFMAAAKIFLRTHVAMRPQVVHPPPPQTLALMYTKRNVHNKLNLLPKSLYRGYVSLSLKYLYRRRF